MRVRPIRVARCVALDLDVLYAQDTAFQVWIQVVTTHNVKRSGGGRGAPCTLYHIPMPATFGALAATSMRVRSIRVVRCVALGVLSIADTSYVGLGLCFVVATAHNAKGEER